MKSAGPFVVLILALAVLVSCAGAPAAVPAAEADAGTSSDSAAAKARAKELVTGIPSTGSTSGTTTGSTSGTATGTATAGTTTPPPADTATPTPVVSDDVPPPAPGVLTDDERAFLERYLAGLDYLVYIDEAAGMDPALAKMAVTQANRYLIEKMGRTVIDFDQVQRNKKDQQAAYMAETGGSIGIMQYLAQKFDADVYVEISMRAAGSERGGRFYASAQGVMKLFDTSTSQLLGSLSFVSPEVMSPTSLDGALSNAVQASIFTAMPKMTDQAKALIEASLANGIRFELLIQNTPDARAISNLRRALARSFRLVEQVSYSPDETRLLVFTFKSATAVEDAVYVAAERAGMPDIYLVFSRGKALTFNSGL
ncbi:MAG TPA: hypothetical protein PKW82_07270 [Spirochaetales bacterium]|nr:hypothetical protein [Spirochaetales bacterium]